ncbi:MAG: 16S rRNA (guanine(527)-N(7))-methyltransferase RsmG [Bacteroidales bacterium]|nr:16S rRNA (guanine(527)-N(7))-methyltransferase RsmG [Bacteroidales bacterium]
MREIKTFFNTLSPGQYNYLVQLAELTAAWNEKINIISRKDIGHLTERHILHSMTIGRYVDFVPGTTILDVGTGGGYPGLPLAVMFPEVNFHLIDGVKKKIMVVNDIINTMGLKNVTAEQCRVEQCERTYDFIVSRAVTALPAFVLYCEKNISKHHKNRLRNGLLYLKGGDFDEELLQLNHWKWIVYELYNDFPLPFFETKKLVYLYR